MLKGVSGMTRRGRPKPTKLLLSMLTFTAIMTTAAVESFAQLPDAYAVTSENTYYQSNMYHENDPLGAATHFHIFTAEDLALNAHTNGNIAVGGKITSANSNSGTSKLIEGEISYVNDFERINSVMFTNENGLLVVGRNVAVTKGDNGNRYELRGSDINAPPTMMDSRLKQIAYETDVSFIDMEREFKALRALSGRLATAERTYSEVSDYYNNDDRNNRIIQLAMADNEHTVIDISPNELMVDTDIRIKGYDTVGANSVIINIDMKGYKAFDVRAPIKLYGINDSHVPNTEWTTWEYGKILWNFYDSGEADGTYKGELGLHLMMGTVLAPDADVYAGQNLDGSIIARRVTIGAETHRNDFTGNIPSFEWDSTTTETTTEETTTEETTEKITETTIEEITETETTTVEETETTTEEETEITTEEKNETTTEETTEITTEETTEKTTETTIEEITETETTTVEETVTTTEEETEVTTEITTEGTHEETTETTTSMVEEDTPTPQLEEPTETTTSMVEEDTPTPQLDEPTDEDTELETDETTVSETTTKPSGGSIPRRTTTEATTEITTETTTNTEVTTEITTELTETTIKADEDEGEVEFEVEEMYASKDEPDNEDKPELEYNEPCETGDEVVIGRTVGTMPKTGDDSVDTVSRVILIIAGVLLLTVRRNDNA
jgi:choice-of-anchor A domain-containing protein